MSDIPLQQLPPVPRSVRRLALRIVLWILVLAIVGLAWIVLLASVAPSRLDLSGGGAILMLCAPPLLLALLGWTSLQFLSAPKSVPSLPESAPACVPAPEVALAPPIPLVGLRIGAWSALTPHGAVTETAEGSKARKQVFKPDKAILHPSGYPAHAGIVDPLDLAATGHAAGTRLRAPRVMAMLAAILDDLHAQKGSLVRREDGPVSVYWLAPDAISGDEAQGAVFARAWQQSAWRDIAYVLQAMRAGEAHLFSVLSSLQSGIGQPGVACTIIVGADSLLDPEELAPALALGQVFSSSAPQGYIPAEGAGGIVLWNPERAPEPVWANAAMLGPVSIMQGAATHAALRSVMSAAITASGMDAADIAHVVSDADHRQQASMAVVAAMQQVLAGLDPLEQRLSPMESAGSFGIAADLVHLALAVELASEKPALALGTAGGQCAGVVVMPA
ncbi:hypothetical protein IGS61_26805 [Janthinobacterium sp. FW305-129]|uniref:hypothetical protein n=1 Tax=Janthinobacterium sp. FW305-129 TaxID=2775054 RepID=UPI001E60188A|nr:hypothetical protein [Janthinobacterium sp. FW305-129]MCC7601126.1 hypothetical protein [Janthinobacterium sp. FW305-129]